MALQDLHSAFCINFDGKTYQGEQALILVGILVYSTDSIQTIASELELLESEIQSFLMQMAYDIREVRSLFYKSKHKHCYIHSGDTLQKITIEKAKKIIALYKCLQPEQIAYFNQFRLKISSKIDESKRIEETVNGMDAAIILVAVLFPQHGWEKITKIFTVPKNWVKNLFDNKQLFKKKIRLRNEQDRKNVLKQNNIVVYYNNENKDLEAMKLELSERFPSLSAQTTHQSKFFSQGLIDLKDSYSDITMDGSATNTLSTNQAPTTPNSSVLGSDCGSSDTVNNEHEGCSNPGQCTMIDKPTLSQYSEVRHFADCGYKANIHAVVSSPSSFFPQPQSNDNAFSLQEREYFQTFHGLDALKW